MNTAPATLAIGKCPRCKAGVSATRAEAQEASWQVLSPCCRRWTALQGVRGEVTARECGEHCTDATGLGCKCECGGAQHGMAWRIR